MNSNTTDNTAPEKPKTNKKSKGPIRWEAILPTGLLLALIYFYFALLFDHNLKSLAEFAGYKIVGAEVNVGSLKTSFWNAEIQIKDIEITDKDTPNLNSIELGEIKFGMSWDALLRAKVLINEASVFQVSYGTVRKTPGKVAPPEPIEPETNEPGIVNEVKDKALTKIEQQNSDNVVGDLASILSGSNGGAELDNLKGSLESKKLADSLSESLANKEKFWTAKFNELPKEKEFQVLSERANKVKIKDFKNLEELQSSLKEFESIGKEFELKYQAYNKAQGELTADLNSIKEQTTTLDAQIKKDIENLENHFHIPKIDAKSLTMSIFGQYLSPYQQKFTHYQGLAKKYLPPKLLSKDKNKKESSEDDLIQARPMAKGKSYEFPKKNSYPLFWIKKIAISSQAGTTANSGNISGEITNITSHQKSIGLPTIAKIAGDFPSKNLNGMNLSLEINNLESDSVIKLDFDIDRFEIPSKNITSSKELSIQLLESQAKLKIVSTLTGLKKLKFNYLQELYSSKFKVDSSNAEIGQTLDGVFNTLPNINLTSSAEGVLPKIDLNIESNFGTELEKSLKAKINQKIEELKSKIKESVDKEIGDKRAEITKQFNDFKAKYEGQIAEIKSTVDKEKKNLEAKSNAAKKETENKAKSQLENEGKKAVEDLKKKFGF